jgi:SNF2 family DNA or RNA helicase
MTGTLVENGLEELWSIMAFVEPGAFGSLIDFRTRFIKRKNNDGLMDLLKPYYLRRTKKEVLADKLPQKHILPPAYFEASLKQRNLAKSLVSSIHAKQANMLTAIMSLRQIYALLWYYRTILK